MFKIPTHIRLIEPGKLHDIFQFLLDNMFLQLVYLYSLVKLDFRPDVDAILDFDVWKNLIEYDCIWLAEIAIISKIEILFIFEIPADQIFSDAKLFITPQTGNLV